MSPFFYCFDHCFVEFGVKGYAAQRHTIVIHTNEVRERKYDGAKLMMPKLATRSRPKSL